MSFSPLIAVDVGNSRIKLGLFRTAEAAGLPEPVSTLHLDGRFASFEQLAEWMAAFSPDACAGIPAPNAPFRWHIGSVNRPAASRLIDWLRDHRCDDEIMLLTSGDLPLTVRLPRPDMVGVDRLLDALAANRLRTPGRKAVVVDVGSAITVDLLDADGRFLAARSCRASPCPPEHCMSLLISCRKSTWPNWPSRRPRWARQRPPRCVRASSGVRSARCGSLWKNWPPARQKSSSPAARAGRCAAASAHPRVRAAPHPGRNRPGYSRMDLRVRPCD